MMSRQLIIQLNRASILHETCSQHVSSLRTATTEKPPLMGRLFMLAVRVRRIELPTTGWKPVVLPLNYTRFVLFRRLF